MALAPRVGRRLPEALRLPARRARAWYGERRSRRPLDLGKLRRTTPIDMGWGSSRGIPIDRVYIERFLERHRADIRGRALEVKDARYVERFGSGIERIDVLDVAPENVRATIVADLQDAPNIPNDSFDCLVLTQVLQYVWDLKAAFRTIRRILAPGGVLLATVPGITRVAVDERECASDAWRLTALSARRLASEAFGTERVHVATFGNVLTATALLYGLAAADLSARDIDAHDEGYPVTIGIRAEKPR